LREGAPGQVLFERATCWTGPPPVSADISGLLGQLVIPPWAAQPRRLADGTAGHGPADDRPAETIADELTQTTPSHDEGDGTAPPDPDQVPEIVADAPLRPLQAAPARIARVALYSLSGVHLSSLSQRGWFPVY
jgi:hypothetical protein